MPPIVIPEPATEPPPPPPTFPGNPFSPPYDPTKPTFPILPPISPVKGPSVHWVDPPWLDDPRKTPGGPGTGQFGTGGAQ